MVKMKTGKPKNTKMESFDEFLETLEDDVEDQDEMGDEDDLDDDDASIDGSGEDDDNGGLEDDEQDEDEIDEGQEADDDDEGEDQEGEMPEEDDSDTEETSLKQHKKSLKNLAKSDPDFFSYLKENDAELLNFDAGDDSSEDDDDDEDKIDAVHKPGGLEVASDSEAEEELLDDQSKEHKQKLAVYLKKGIVNLHVIANWEKTLSTTKDLGILSNVIEAFECAVESILKEEAPTGLKWRIEGSANFNALMRLCIRNIKSFCVRFLCGSNNIAFSEKRFDENPQDVMEKSKGKWVRLRPKIKAYMKSLVTFLKSMGNPEAIAAVLRHCQKMSGFWALMTTKSFKLLKTFINIWSTGEDSCRVAAFLSIIRMTNYNKTVYLARVLKQMYIAYVANSKFTSVNSWPAINFMRGSLVEAYLLDTEACYAVAFPFIRQLAIHLRNAVTAGTAEQQGKQGKKDASRIVYSWQFVHSVHVWTDLLARSIGAGDESLRLLVYPVVQICLGTIKLIPTRKYIPLRFHIIRMLITLQDKTKIFIPILPLVTEVLNMTDFTGKTSGKFSVRPLDLQCCLKADSEESGYFKAVSESVFDGILGTCKAIATELAFPEVVTPTLMQLKTFIKKSCRNAEVSKKYKTLIEKIEAHSDFIKAKRTKAMDEGLVSLADQKSHQILRVQIETSKPEPPILAYARDYFKLNAKFVAKSKKNQSETKDERRIPKPVSKAASKSKATEEEDVFGAPMFSRDELPEEDSDNEESSFRTKLDISEAAEDTASGSPEKSKSKKSKKRKLSSTEEGKSKVKKVKGQKKNVLEKKPKKHQRVADIEDQVVDFELSD